MNTNKMRIRVTFLENILGTNPNNKEIFSDYISSKAPDAKTRDEEVEEFGADEVRDKQTTVFNRTADGKPFFYDYHVKGFFKDTCGALRQVKGTECSGVKSYKKLIDGLIFVFPRKVVFNDVLPEEITLCERPLRASTPQGERVALACSESIPAGKKIEFTIELLKPELKDWVVEMLNYGVYRGFGQWRNASHGRFCWEELDAEGNVIGGNYHEYMD